MEAALVFVALAVFGAAASILKLAVEVAALRVGMQGERVDRSKAMQEQDAYRGGLLLELAKIRIEVGELAHYTKFPKRRGQR